MDKLDRPEILIVFCSVIGVLLILLVCWIISGCLSYRQKKSFVNRAVEENDISERTAKDLFNAAWTSHQFRRINQCFGYRTIGKVERWELNAIMEDDSYNLHRWAKRLNEAKNRGYDRLYREVGNMENEMIERANLFTIDPRKSKRLVELARQPESLLRKYDDYFKSDRWL